MRDEELNKTLIARLREIQGQAGLFASAAADRIEALSISNATLIAERDEALEWLSASQGYIADAVYALDKQEAAEAKLAENEVRLRKAVKALELIVVDNTWGLEHQTYMKCRKALAEIKSGVATTPYGLEGESHD